MENDFHSKLFEYTIDKLLAKKFFKLGLLK